MFWMRFWIIYHLSGFTGDHVEIGTPRKATWPDVADICRHSRGHHDGHGRRPNSELRTHRSKFAKERISAECHVVASDGDQKFSHHISWHDATQVTVLASKFDEVIRCYTSRCQDQYETFIQEQLGVSKPLVIKRSDQSDVRFGIRWPFWPSSFFSLTSEPPPWRGHAGRPCINSDRIDAIRQPLPWHQRS